MSMGCVYRRESDSPRVPLEINLPDLELSLWPTNFLLLRGWRFVNSIPIVCFYPLPAEFGKPTLPLEGASPPPAIIEIVTLLKRPPCLSCHTPPTYRPVLHGTPVRVLYRVNPREPPSLGHMAMALNWIKYLVSLQSTRQPMIPPIESYRGLWEQVISNIGMRWDWDD